MNKSVKDNKWYWTVKAICNTTGI